MGPHRPQFQAWSAITTGHLASYLASLSRVTQVLAYACCARLIISFLDGKINYMVPSDSSAEIKIKPCYRSVRNKSASKVLIMGPGTQEVLDKCDYCYTTSTAIVLYLIYNQIYIIYLYLIGHLIFFNLRLLICKWQ